MKTLLALALLAATVPAALADGCDPSGSVCDSTTDAGPCDEGGYQSRTTSGPFFSGTSWCSGTNRGSDFNAFGLVGWSTFAYDDPENGHFEGCTYFVAGQPVACVVTPPDPWGHVLP